MQRHVMAIAGVELELFEVGEGPPILYLHNGGGFDPEHEFVRLLSVRRRLIAPSHPGFGQSSLPDWIDSVDDIAHIHLELMDRLGLRQRRPGRLLDRRLDRRRNGDQSRRNASTSSRWSARVGVKTGPDDKLDIPDIFAHAAGRARAHARSTIRRTHADRSHALTDEQLRSWCATARRSRCSSGSPTCTIRSSAPAASHDDADFVHARRERRAGVGGLSRPLRAAAAERTHRDHRRSRPCAAYRAAGRRSPRRCWRSSAKESESR